MNATEILKELEGFADAQTKKTLMTHGAQEPLFGVKIADLKKILKKTKKNHELSLELYKTGNSDAMYLAGLMADETKITESDLDEWVENAYWLYLNEYAVPWVASETPFGFSIGLKWIASEHENTACAGWATLSNYASVRPDEKLDIKKYSELLDFVEKNIHSSPNRVKRSMNAFVIAIGSFIKELNEKALETAKNIGKVEVILSGTACKTPLATEYINKVVNAGKLGKKRSTARC
ncbi:DNA alkylation repair protein [Flavobacterium sp.]|uniref:DNA alkylation repair protein n=1 Tax=Flavobacterium sp. TaxID=239 RepID=UPI002B4ADE65|nr:DNA alkylation repair protein [Flavobacterium sp.]HLP62959.1 DNA alkylation repair protein [Flavobacterium sp.]